MKIEDSPAVRKWFFKETGEKRYTKKTKRNYRRFMRAIFCPCLGKTPDEIIDEIKQAKNQGEIIKRNHRKILAWMKERGVMIRVINQRFNALNSFYKYNGINISSELKRAQRDITAKAFKPDFEKAMRA